MSRLILRWTAGLVVGTILIALTSPLFVRSYLPLVVDPIRETWVLPPDHHYRWRSEGYATSDIGPHGMPGRSRLNGRSGVPRLALYGDSQAEGVCVPDRFKLFAQLERSIPAEESCDVLPFARSGEDAAVWLTQMPRVEDELKIDAHAMLIVDLPDLLSATEAPQDPPTPGDERVSFTRYLPAFVIDAARRLLTEADESTPRRLRFRPGPVDPSPAVSQPVETLEFDWPAIMTAIRSATDKPLLLIYAPPIPQIINGKLVEEPPFAEEVPAMMRAARQNDIQVLDARRELIEAAAEGSFPHGFHNGQIGLGHLNATGYALIADIVANAIPRLIGPERPVGEARSQLGNG